MAISVFERLQSKMDKVNNDDIYNIICRNIKRFRMNLKNIIIRRGLIHFLQKIFQLC